MITLSISIRAYETRHNGTLALKACPSWYRSDGTFSDWEDRTCPLRIAVCGLRSGCTAYCLHLHL
jgi:hypothetical protein